MHYDVRMHSPVIDGSGPQRTPSVEQDRAGERVLSAADERASKPAVLVFGPLQPEQVACGVSSAMRAFADSCVRERYRIAIHSTFRPARKRNIVQRLAHGVRLLVSTAFRMLRSGAVVADIHAVSDRSLLSHAAVMFGALLVRRPAILRIHGGDFHRTFETAGGAERRLIRLILRAASRLVVLSEIWRGRVAAIQPLARIEVIPNPVNCAQLAKLGGRSPRPCRRILFLANFCERKGHFDAIEALALVVPRYPDVLLVLCGEDRDEGAMARIQARCAELGITANVLFRGTVSGAAKDEEFRLADVLILPSHTENMPISVIEGMAAGLPVVASSVGAVPEMIRHGETGLLVTAQRPAELASSLESLLADSGLGRRIGATAARVACDTWDADVVACRTIAVYQQLAGTAPR
jgi:glycosyltransferase involved in cell wall biosynthesis